MGKERILFLGGSMQQVPVIEKAKAMGYETILIDYLPDNPGQYVADRWYPESTTDIEAVYRIARDENVKGILPYASDPAALPAAIVSERLNLPTNPSSSVRILGMKHEFRKFLKEKGFPSPSTFIFSPEDDIKKIIGGISGLTFPIVVKPTDSSGSKGVSFLNNEEELEKAISHASGYSRNKVLIAEEFIDRGFPYVIGGDIFVENGRIILFGEMSCIRDNNGKSLIPVGKKYPSGLTEEQTEIIHEELQSLIDAIGICNGELNIELLLDKDDKPHFLEIGPRAGGNMIPIQLSDIYNIDLIEANIKAAMGLATDIVPEETDRAYMTHVLHSSESGIFKGIDFSPELESFIYRKVIYKKEGDGVEAFDGAGKALGIIFMKFPSEEEMNKIEKKLEELITINLK